MINRKTKQIYFLIGVFLMCMCGLMLQIMQTRMLSVILYYHMAFFAIGIAMLGMTAGALLVFFEKLPSVGPLSRVVAWVMCCFAWSTLLSLVLLLNVAITPRFEPTLRFLSLWAITILVMLPSYVFLGIGVSLVLTRSQYPVARGVWRRSGWSGQRMSGHPWAVELGLHLFRSHRRGGIGSSFCLVL